MKGARVFFGLTASSTTDDAINTRVQDAKTFLKMKRIPLKIKVLLCKTARLFQNKTNTGPKVSSQLQLSAHTSGECGHLAWAQMSK